MPHQILLRQLTRKLRPGTLAGFWQGRYTLQPWNEVANSAYSQPPVPQGQSWDAGADFGFAAHQHITNPTTGLDSIYQKHVWSRLGTVEPPESSDTDGQAQAKALAAAAAFVTLQPAAAAAAALDDEEAHKHKIASLSVPASLKPAMPAAVLPFIAEAPLDKEQAADTDVVSAKLRGGLSTIQEEPEEASASASEAAPSQVAPSAAAKAQGSQICQTSPAADAEADREEATGSEATGTAASTSQATKLPASVAAGGERHCSSAVVSHEAGLASAANLSAGANSLQQHPAAEPAGCSSEELLQHAERAAAKQLMPLPVLTALDTAHVSRRDPQAVLSAAMHAAHAVPLGQDRLPTTAFGNKQAETAVSTPVLMSIPTKAERSAKKEPQRQSRSAVPLHSSSHIRKLQSPPSQISRAVPAVSCPVKQIFFMPPSRPEVFASNLLTSRPITAAAAAAAAIATRSPGHEVQAKTAAAGGQRAMQTALPKQALKSKHIAASAPAAHAQRPTANALRPVMAALGLLLDADSINISGHIPGLVIARGEVCGRPVYACYLDTDSIAPSSQPAACRALCGMMDAAILVGTPVVTIHGSCPRSTTHNYSSASASPAADLAAWMPAVQRHMDASGVVPQLAVSQGHLSPVSSLLASTCDYNFTQHGSRSGCRAAEVCIQDCGSAPESGSCSGCRAAEHSEQHDSCSSSNSSSLCCKQELSQQEGSSSIACTSMEEALHQARQLLAMLPSSDASPAPKVPCHDPPWRSCTGLQHIQSPLNLCNRLADAGLVAGSWAGAGTAVCFGRLDCTAVGFVAMPCSAVIPGAHSRSSLAQVIKTVRFCNAFNLPIISLLLLHDKGAAASETDTRMSDLANLIFAYSEAAVPKLAVVCGPEALPAAKCLKSDIMLLWTSNTEWQRDQESSGVGRSHEAWESAPHCVSIRQEETRSELCKTLEPLMKSRLVAVPRRKHALLPKVC